MDNTKKKAYLLFAGIGLIILIPIVSIIYNKIKDSKLYDEGLKVDAIVKKLDRSRNPRTRTFNYSMNVEYKAGNGKTYSEEIPINYDIYRDNQVGKSIEILVDNDNPTSITLVDAARYYNTEERVLNPKDLIEFYEDSNTEYILSRLAKISVGWTPLETDSTILTNSKRQSFIKLTADSVTYFGNLRNENDLKQYLNGLNIIRSGKFYPGYLTDIPFGKIPEPKQKIRMPVMFKAYQYNNYELLTFNQIDYANKPWVVLSIKSTD